LQQRVRIVAQGAANLVLPCMPAHVENGRRRSDRAGVDAVRRNGVVHQRVLTRGGAIRASQRQNREAPMDLATVAPRSPKDKLAGLVSLKRTIDKARAYNEGRLGEYDYDCPHDKPLFEFLGTTGDEFAAKVRALGSDRAIVEWLESSRLGDRSQTQIDAFNAERMRWHPEPGSHSEDYFKELRSKVAPGRPEIVTWFDLLDLDEGRPVPEATRLER
jgi:Domain of unknown function (DUF5069)